MEEPRRVPVTELLAVDRELMLSCYVFDMKSVLLMGVMVYLVVLFGASVPKEIARILSLVEYKLKRLPRGCIVQI